MTLGELEAQSKLPPYSSALCLHTLFERQAAKTPDAIAIRFCGQEVTYRQLNRQANEVSHELLQLGIEQGSRVCVYLQRTPKLIAALLGVLKSGASYVPLDATYPMERLAFMASDARAGAIITEAALAAAQDAFGSLPTLLMEQVDGGDDGEAPDASASAADIAYIIYTSGSTGDPKGVGVPHGAIVNNIRWMLDHFQIGASDCILQKTEVGFDPSVWEIFVPLAVGGQIVIPALNRHHDALYVAQLIQSKRITILNCVPSFLALLLDTASFSACTSLRLCLCGGEAMSSELARRFYTVHRAPLHNMYGPTEAAITSLSYCVPRDGPDERIPIGRPVFNTQAFILDQRKELVPPGAPGELYLGGAQLAEGYHRRPELTAARFLRHRVNESTIRLYRTGDKVRMRPDGCLEFLGRLDDQIKFRGFRVEPGEIEVVLRTCRKVRDALVSLKQDPMGDLQLTAYVIAKEASDRTERDIRSFLEGRLPHYMIPTRIIVLDAFPLTPNGKIDRLALPPPDRQAMIAADTFAARTPTEKALAAVWRSILGTEDIGSRDNFFECGGHSLAAVRVVTRINQIFPVKIGVGHIYSLPTIERLARTIDLLQKEGPQSCTIMPIGGQPSRPAIYFIAGGPWSHRLGRLLGKHFSTFAMERSWPNSWRKRLVERQTSGLPEMEEFVEPFVTALLEQPSPQRILVGHSFEGVMAFEIARQLERRGLHVELVILLDTRMNELHDNALRRWRTRWEHGTSMIAFLRQCIASFKRAMVSAESAGAPSCIVDQDGTMPPWDIVERMYRTISRSYQPKAIEARGVLFVAQAANDHYCADFNDSAAWRCLFRKALDVVPVPGDHISMVQTDENLRVLADAITAAVRSNVPETGRPANAQS